jgi:hypothetical protein
MRAIAWDPAMTLFENETFTIEHVGMTITVMDGRAGVAMPAKKSSSMLRARGGMRQRATILYCATECESGAAGAPMSTHWNV